MLLLSCHVAVPVSVGFGLIDSFDAGSLQGTRPRPPDMGSHTSRTSRTSRYVLRNCTSNSLYVHWVSHTCTRPAAASLALPPARALLFKVNRRRRLFFLYQSQSTGAMSYLPRRARYIPKVLPELWGEGARTRRAWIGPAGSEKGPHRREQPGRLR